MTLSAVTTVIELTHHLRTWQRLRAASRSPAPVVLTGAEGGSAHHLASVGGRLATSNNKTVVDHVKRGLTVG